MYYLCLFNVITVGLTFLAPKKTRIWFLRINHLANPAPFSHPDQARYRISLRIVSKAF